MLFREATIEDIPQLTEIRMSVKENRLSDPHLITAKEYEDYLANRGKGWVCEINNDVVGFAIIDLIENNVWALFIKPEYDRKGIGKELHNEMMNWYFKQTDKTAWLSTSAGTRAEGFYYKAGWNKTGIQPNGEIRFEMTTKDWNRKGY